MTHSGGKPHNVGDKGQRYEVRAIGWPKDGESIVGWCPTLEGAERMASATRTAPGCVVTKIIDRKRDG